MSISTLPRRNTQFQTQYPFLITPQNLDDHVTLTYSEGDDGTITVNIKVEGLEIHKDPWAKNDKKRILCRVNDRKVVGDKTYYNEVPVNTMVVGDTEYGICMKLDLAAWLNGTLEK